MQKIPGFKTQLVDWWFNSTTYKEHSFSCLNQADQILIIHFWPSSYLLWNFIFLNNKKKNRNKLTVRPASVSSVIRGMKRGRLACDRLLRIQKRNKRSTTSISRPSFSEAWLKSTCLKNSDSIFNILKR